MNTTTVAGVLLRTVAVATLARGAMALVEATSGPVVGADIGAGLAALAATLVLAGLWGVVDGFRTDALARVALRWLAVGVASAPVFAAASQVGAPAPFDWGLWAIQVVTTGWLWGGLVAVPALVGAAVATAVRGPAAPVRRPA